MDIFHCLNLLQGESEGGGWAQMLLFLGGMIAIMYFIMFRPQMKEQKRRRAMLAAIKKHDHVVTNGGIHGVVVSVGETEVVLKIDENNNIRVKFARSAISAVVKKEEEE